MWSAESEASGIAVLLVRKEKHMNLPPGPLLPSLCGPAAHAPQSKEGTGSSEPRGFLIPDPGRLVPTLFSLSRLVHRPCMEGPHLLAQGTLPTGLGSEGARPPPPAAKMELRWQRRCHRWGLRNLSRLDLGKSCSLISPSAYLPLEPKRLRNEDALQAEAPSRGTSINKHTSARPSAQPSSDPRTTGS